MADKHTLNCDVRELKLGTSFTNNKASQYHTIKYDFKPASVDVNKMATVEVGTNNQVSVTVPHLDGAGVPQTVFRGNQRPYTKECVLIIDRVTGEITLEKLSSNIQVKKTRQESSLKPRPLTPVLSEFTNTTQRSTSRTRVATNRRTHNTGAGPSPGAGASAPPHGQPRHAGAGAAPPAPPAPAAGAHKPPPQSMLRSPQRQRTSPPQAAPWSGGGNSTLASLPMIGLDDVLAPPSHAPPSHAPSAPAHAPAHAPARAYAPPPERPPPERPQPNIHVPAPTPAAETVPHQGSGSKDANGGSSDLPVCATEPWDLPPHPQSVHLKDPKGIAASQDDSSSSSSSGSGSDSDSDSGSDEDAGPRAARPALPNGTGAAPALPSDVLNDDLCLSESGSDSD